MTNEHVNPSTYCYYYPLVRRGDRFAETGLDADLLQPAADIEPYLRRHHTQAKAMVELRGRIANATIWIPSDANDFAYIAVDADREPIEKLETIQLTEAETTILLEELRKRVSVTETALPGHAVSIESDFIPPRFTLLEKHTDCEGRTIEWNSLHNFARVVLLGAPGAGKTSCLRRLALDLMNETEENGKTVPIYIVVRELANQELDLQTISRIATTLGSVALAIKVPALVAYGQLVLLLDGLDEVPDDNRSSIISGIRNLAIQYPRLRFVVSSRSSTYAGELSDFVHLQIQPFGPAEIRQFACQQLHATRSWRTFLSSLAANSEVSELASNPLILSLATTLFQRHSYLPCNRTVLIESFIKSLVEDWDGSRGVVRRRDQWAAPDRKISFLCNVAFRSALESVSVFDESSVRSWIRNSAAHDSAGLMLQLAEEHTGLICADVERRWRFSHRSFQEFLAAKYLVSNVDDVVGELSARLTDRGWREIWRFSCCLASDPGKLVEAVLGKEEILADVRASLVASALGESIDLNTGLARRSCAFIAKAAERLVEEFQFDEKAGLGVHSDAVWWVAFTPNQTFRSTNADQMHRLRELVKQVYEVRNSIWAKTLSETLHSSSSLGVRRLCAGLAFEGTLKDKVVVSGANSDVVFSVVRELPSVGA